MEEKIKKVVENSFRILTELNRYGFSKETKLIIPDYQNNQNEDSGSEKTKRISEQELRFVFVEQLNKALPEGFYYSIETPTERPYKFSEGGQNSKPIEREKGKSGNFDLTIQNEKKQVLAIVEFKSKSATPHSYAKDLCKLWNPAEGLGKDTLRYFINVFETMDKQTKNRFVQKIKKNDYFKKQENDVDVIIVGKSLTENQTDYEVFAKDKDLITV